MSEVALSEHVVLQKWSLDRLIRDNAAESFREYRDALKRAESCVVKNSSDYLVVKVEAVAVFTRGVDTRES